MKIAVMSDLHLEFDWAWIERRGKGAHIYQALDSFQPPTLAADILVLAGNIHSGAHSFDWAQKHFAIPTILVAGNHEAYDAELFEIIALNRCKSIESDHTIFLEKASYEFRSCSGQKARFIGTTLWTDFLLYQTPLESMAVAQKAVEDFQCIKIERGYKIRTLTAADTARLHKTSVDFLKDELGRHYDGLTIVVTHHAPSPASISPRFAKGLLNPAFTSNLEEMIWRYQPALWVHGHVHDSFNYSIGQTRVVCNPRGYFPHELNPQFNPNFIVDV